MPSASETANPFSGGACFVNPPTWQGVLRQLLHLAQFSGGLQVVDGEVGAGKTVFAHHMSRSLPDDVCCGVLALPPGLPTSQVFDCLLTSLGVDVNDGQSVGQSIIALRHYDAELKQEQLRKILIIDDAHNFDDQALAALASVFQGGADTEVGLALVFIGEPGTAQRLDSLNLVDVEVRDCILPAFSLSDATELLTQEFAETHEGQAFPFDDDTVCALWNESAGRPGELLRLAQAAWLEAGDARSAWWSRVPIWHALAIVVLIVALAWGFLAQNFGRETAEEAIVPANVPALQQDTADGARSSASKAASSINVAAITDAPNRAAVNEAGGSTTSSAENQAQKGAEQSSASSEAVGQAEPSAEAGEPARLAIDVIAAPSANSESARQSTAGQPREAKAAKPASAPAQAKAPSVPAPRPKPELEGLTPDESALMAMPPGGYVLQVSAAKSLSALQQFVEAQPNNATLRIYRSLRSGKSWFVVVEGFYADKDSALAAMSNLPSGQLKAGPWPKSMAAVKLEIAAYKQQAP
ncbi:MAG TPA: AAA family ATPase [Marinagarivorans sp.]